MSPRNVRNFFLDGVVGGRDTPIRTGPIAKDGGFYLEILMREEGRISDYYLSIIGEERDGQLTLSVWEKDTKLVVKHTTQR